MMWGFNWADWGLAANFSEAILTMESSNTNEAQNLRAQVFHTDRDCADYQSDSLTQAVTISDMAGLFLFSGSFCGIALLVAVANHLEPRMMLIMAKVSPHPHPSVDVDNASKLEPWFTNVDAFTTTPAAKDLISPPSALMTPEGTTK